LSEENSESIIKFIRSGNINEKLQQFTSPFEKLKASIAFLDRLNSIALENIKGFDFATYLTASVQITMALFTESKNESPFLEKSCLFLLSIFEEGFKIFPTIKNWEPLINTIISFVGKMDESFEKWNLIIRFADSHLMENNEIIKKILDASKNKAINCINDKINEGLINIKAMLNNRSKNKKLELMEETLEKLKASQLISGINQGRFDKKEYMLTHSVLIGLDGGLYMLLNKLSNDEYEEILIQNKNEVRNYFENSKKKLEILPNNLKKIVIGEGGLGKIRLALVLVPNNNSKIGKSFSMIGDLICLKKTRNNQKIKSQEIRANTLKDYVSDNMGKYIFSPEIYDLCLIIKSEEKHNKGYTMQRFIPIRDGTIFQSKKSTDLQLQTWFHQRKYFIDIFSAILELLKKNAAMTDLKPGNTLYDPANGRGNLIDLAGLVIKQNIDELKSCKIVNISEFTEKYTAPEILENQEKGDFKVDLTKSIAYGLGIMLEELVIKPCQANKREKEYPFFLISKVKEFMTKKNPNERWSIEDGLAMILDSKKQEFQIEKADVDQVTQVVSRLKELFVNSNFLPEFGLPKYLDDVINKNNWEKPKYEIQTNSPNQKQKREILLIDDFISNFLKSKENILFILGKRCTGKTTLLQKYYKKQVESWKPEDPFPFYIDILNGVELQEQWLLFNERLLQIGKHFFLPFSTFIGKSKYPLLLFIDNFDEIKQNFNLVLKIYKELEENENVTMIITRQLEDYSEEVEKNYKDEICQIFKKIDKLILVPSQDKSFYKFNQILNNYGWKQRKGIINRIWEFYYNSTNLSETHKDYIFDIIFPRAFENFFRKKESIEIERYELYSYLMLEIIKNFHSKFPLEINQQMQNDFLLLKIDDIFQLHFSFAKDLSRYLQITDKTVIINDMDGIEFFNKYKYNKNKDFRDQSMFHLTKSLDLLVHCNDIDKTNQQILIGFKKKKVHDFYLIYNIFEELENKTYSIFSSRTLKSDQIKKFAGILKDEKVSKEKFSNLLRECLENSKSQNCKNQTSNAISFLLSLGRIDLINKTYFRDITMFPSMISECDFQKIDFINIDFLEPNFENSRFDSCKFINTKIMNPNFFLDGYWKNCTKINYDCFVECQFLNFELLGGKIDCKGQFFKNCTFEKIKIKNFDPGHFHFENYNFSNANMSESDFSGSKFEKCVFVKCISRNSQYRNVSFIECDFTDADLTGSCFNFTMSECDFNGSKFEKCVFAKCISRNSQYRKVSFIECDFTDADLTGSDFYLSHFEKCIINGTIFTNASFGVFPEIILDEDIEILCTATFGNHNLYPLVYDEKNNSTLKNESGNFQILVGCSSTKIILLEMRDFDTKLIRKFEKAHTKEVISVSFSIDGTQFLSGSNDETIILWDKTTGARIKTFLGNNSPVVSVCFSIDSETIITPSNNLINIWSKNSGKVVKALSGHIEKISLLTISAERKILLSLSLDSIGKIWDLITGENLETFQNETYLKKIKNAAFSTNNIFFVKATGSVMTTFDKINYSENFDPLDYENECFPSCLAFSPDNKLVLKASKNVIYLKKIQEYDHFQLDFEGICCFSPDGQYILALNAANQLFLWDRKSNTIIDRIHDTSAIIWFSLAPNGKEILYQIKGGDFRNMELFSLKKEPDCFRVGSAFAICLQTNLKFLFIDPKDCDICLFKILHVLEKKIDCPHKQFSSKYALSSNEKYLLLISRSEILLYVIFPLGFVRSFEIHTKNVTAVCFSVDDTRALSASEDKIINFWELESGKEVMTYDIHAVAEFLSFSPKGDFILCGTDNGSIILVETLSGKLVHKIKKESKICSLDFSPDGNEILSGFKDGSILTWRLRKNGKEWFPSLIARRGFKNGNSFNKVIDLPQKIYEVMMNLDS